MNIEFICGLTRVGYYFTQEKLEFPKNWILLIAIIQENKEMVHPVMDHKEFNRDV